MHNTNGKIVRAITTNSVNDNRTLSINRELNGNNIILLRGAKSPDNNNGGHILLRTTTTTTTTAADSLNATKTNLVCDAKLGQIFIQQSDLTDGVLLQSVKRLGTTTGTPILLLSGNDNGNSHILIQTSSSNDETQTHAVEFHEERATDNILVQALEGLQDNESNNTHKAVVSTPLGSGKF